MSRKLIVNDGRRQRELLLVSKIVVGRDPTCDLSEADPLLSRRHAEFSISGDDIVVRDLGSRNGIYLNGARIAEGTLQSGDVIRIGHLQVRYLEDASPLVSVPELMDDATGLVLPGPRGTATPKPASVVAPRPATGASAAIPRPPAPPSSTSKPDASASQPRPAPAPSGDHDADVTSYVSPSAMRRSRAASQSSAKLPPPQPPPSRAPQPVPPPAVIAQDEAEQTRVVPAPGRTGLRPKPEPLQPTAGEHTSVQPPPMTPTVVQPPPGPPGAMHTALQPPPTPPAEDVDEPTSVVLAPRPRTRVEPPAAVSASEATAREARALVMAIEAIATFFGSASISRTAADAVKTLERDLASGAPPADLVAALKGLAARLSAAANELT